MNGINKYKSKIRRNKKETKEKLLKQKEEIYLKKRKE